MFRDSVVTMTIIDVMLVLTLVILAITVFRMRKLTPGSSVRFGTAISIVGFGLLSVLFLADLISMHALPWAVGETTAQLVSNIISLDTKWIIVAVSMPLITIGSVLVSIERKRAVELLEVSEERYRSIVQDQIDMIVRWKPDGTRIWVNEPYCRNLGSTAAGAINTNIFEHVEDAESLIRIRDSLTPDAPIHTSQHDVALPDGTTGCHEWVDRGLFDSSGELIAIQSIGRDVTHQVRTARALQESESRFRGFVENTPDFVWEADLDLRCLYSNQQCRQLLGYEPAEMRQISLLDIVHPDKEEEIRAEFANRIEKKIGWHEEQIKLRHRNGSVRYVESNADPLLDENGNIVGYRGIYRDRTFQTVLTKLSIELVDCKEDAISDTIDKYLNLIGQIYDFDRLAIWRQKDDFVHCNHEWVRVETMCERLQVVKTSAAPLTNKIVLEDGKTLKIESLQDLPADSLDRAFLEDRGVKSVMALPLIDDESIVAFAVCTMISRERSWPDDMESELRLLFDKIQNASRQAENTLALVRREKDLSQSEELAQVGSYAFYPNQESGDFPDRWEAHFSTQQCALLEARPDEATIDLFMDRIHEADRYRIENAMRALVENGTKFEQEFRFLNPSGSIVHIAGRAELEIVRPGVISRIVGACRDITEQDNREEALVNALEDNEALRNRLQEENIQLREEIRSFTEFEQIIGDSNALRASLNLAAKAAPTDSTILILGETGTGKELVAKAMHKLSSRSDQRLVSINCTALPPNLIESELFGHERGAFTGASARRPGRFEIADGGTLFLDEIGDLPVELQAKLLRVLEDGSFERLGGNKTIRPDVRLIAATNRNLETAVQKGEFRADLYYRINTVPIELPPLRDRKEDIPMLAQHFVEKHCERLGKSVIAISSRMIEFLLNRDWPGNVRELEHYIERSLISSTGKVLSIGENSAQDDGSTAGISISRPTKLRSVEREHILQVLKDTGWVIDGTRGAAAILGLAPSTLRSRMKRLGIARRA